MITTPAGPHNALIWARGYLIGSRMAVSPYVRTVLAESDDLSALMDPPGRLGRFRNPRPEDVR